MKRLLILVLLLLSIFITGCNGKQKVELEDIYGKYYYKECVYLNERNVFNKDALNDAYKDVARYSIKESTFAFYQTESQTPTISLKHINYKEVDVDENIESKEVKKLLKKCTTRFDIYRLEISQGYSFAFDGDNVYFIEFRSTNNVHEVWHIFSLEKRD